MQPAELRRQRQAKQRQIIRALRRQLHHAQPQEREEIQRELAFWQRHF
ncbi:MAG TPA: hypothetical protein V6D02_04390 [Candidatus Obscuribacterales bacterium]